MSLTANDLQEIRNIVDTSLFKQTRDIIEPIQNELEAIRNDLKDIYDMISDLQKNSIDDDFDNLSLEKKVLLLYSKLFAVAKQAGITLPKE
jgi:division protein CdvB (Snf7/Vps24/ESCRT-III family)